MIICDHCRAPKTDQRAIGTGQVELKTETLTTQVGRPADLCEQCRTLFVNELVKTVIDFCSPPAEAK